MRERLETTEEKDLIRETLKEMGSTLVAVFITVAFSAAIIGLPGLITVALGYDFSTALVVGFLFYLITVLLLLWFMAEYGAVERKYRDQGTYREEI